MTSVRAAAFAGAIIFSLGTSAAAQTPATQPRPATSVATGPRSGGCAAGTGIRITGLANDSTGLRLPEIDLGKSIDTVITINVAERRWTRSDFAAAISVGWSDAPRSQSAICAGINLFMRQASLVVRGARGQVHFRAALADLN